MPPLINSTFLTLDGVINQAEKWHFGFVGHAAPPNSLAQLHLRRSRSLFMEQERLLHGGPYCTLGWDGWAAGVGENPVRRSGCARDESDEDGQPSAVSSWRSRARLRPSSRETCIWEMPSRAAICDWVMFP